MPGTTIFLSLAFIAGVAFGKSREHCFSIKPDAVRSFEKEVP